MYFCFCDTLLCLLSDTAGTAITLAVWACTKRYNKPAAVTSATNVLSSGFPFTQGALKQL